MTSAGELHTTLASLQRQAEALAELQRRCAQLTDGRRPSHAQLDAVATAIDASIDACLLIAEHAAGADPGGEWQGAVTELERQIRRLAVLRSHVVALHLGAVDVSSATDTSRGRFQAES